MTMNIYIKPQNEELLRRYDGSMSGLVNRLLENFFSGNPAAATGVRREVDKAFDLPKKSAARIGLPAISPSAGDHQTSNPAQPKKIADEPRYVNDEDIPGDPTNRKGTL